MNVSLIFLFSAIWACCFCNSAVAQDEAISPDYKYTVKITKIDKSDASDTEDSNLTIYEKQKMVCSFRTYGYLQNVIWSPDETYVAINNRRSNSGDYLWIIRLTDGSLIRKPVDALTLDPDDKLEGYLKSVAEITQTKYPELTLAHLEKLFVTAQEWTNPCELKINILVRFTDIGDNFILIIDTNSIMDKRLVLTKRQIDKEPNSKPK